MESLGLGGTFVQRLPHFVSGHWLTGIDPDPKQPTPTPGINQRPLAAFGEARWMEEICTTWDPKNVVVIDV